MLSSDSLEKLRKIVSLEASRGYDNQSVFGGLDKVLPTWQAEARAEGVSEDLIEAIASRLRDYPRLSEGSRQEALEGILKRLERESNETAGPPGTEAPERGSQDPRDVQVTRPQEGVDPTPADTAPEYKEIPPGSPLEAPDSGPDGGTEEEEEEASEDFASEEERPSDVTVGAGSTDESSLLKTPGPGSPSVRDSSPAPTVQELGRLAGQPAALDAPLTVLPGVGEKSAQRLERLGLSTLGDLLYFVPRKYDDYTRIKPINRLWYGEEVTVIGTVQSAASRTIPGRGLTVTEAVITDGSGSLRITWFNQPWIAKSLKQDRAIVVSGKVDQYLGRLTMNTPEWEPLEKENLHTNRIVPVYPLTARITQRWIRRLMYKVVSYWAPRLRDPLPDELRSAASLVPLAQAVEQVHYPGSWESLKAAQERLAFDEIFLLQMGVQRQKREWRQLEARVFETADAWLAGELEKLPYPLTGAQRRAVDDIRADLGSGRPMNRLLQGDVGSGKTVVAALSIGMVAASGAQAALMAPSSILAEQHYLTLQDLLMGERGIMEAGQIRLLLGDTPEGEKAEIRQALADGRTKLVIGTHALIEDPVEFQDLELVIIDEQHRFGVEQRAALREKGTNPHLLVMTATPIPRSLALTLYGDLDLTLIDEMPPGRKPVSTHVVYPRERERIYTLIRGQAREGRQSFIIYPLVEESENSESKAAVEEYGRLQTEIFPELSLDLLHGRLKADEKEAVMARFRDNETQVMVSTSVVEVGVDIPNASVMVVEGANRFGLAQLHQLRGRVGRGSEDSYCILIPEREEVAENARLEAMVETTDGFVLAERDLDQRGPGDFLGTRQSGFAELKMASLTDVRLIEKARRFAQELFDRDPELSDPQHGPLRQAIDRFWGGGKGDIS